MIAVWIILGLVVVIVIYLVALYNGLIGKRNRVDNSWAQIEVQLKRRHDLIPNLVETVKGYAAHERGTFEAVTQARAAAMGAQGPAQAAAAEGILGQALGRLFAVAEAYPDLKASTNFLDLQTQLQDTENKVAVSRQVYNDTVLTYNNGIQVFPAVLIAGPFGFTRREFFEVEADGDRQVPTVSFQPDAPRQPAVPPPAMHQLRRRRSVFLAAALAALAIAGGAEAKSFSLPQADVSIRVAADGAVVVDEHITYAFSGPFTGGYREIPLRSGESVDDVRVSENGRSYRPGGCTELKCADAPGTFGTAVVGRKVRIVWHYAAANELRTFDVHYRLAGVAVAYDDVVDVNLQVWGSEWDEPLGRLTATETAPGKILRAWGHPVYVRGDVQLAGEKVLLRALNVPAGQFVELRTVIPRAAFSSTTGMRIASGDGLEKIVAAETADAAAFEKDRERIDHAKQHPWRYAVYLLLLGTIPGFLVVAGVFWFYGRELRTTYDREYEQEPPTETEPALVPTLLRQGGEAGSFEFTATLFDLIRRGVFTSAPVTTERSIWGGLRSESVSDLELSPGKRDQQLTPWEEAVASVVDGVIEDGPERLSRFRKRIEAERATMSPHFTAFKGNVGTEVGNRKWFDLTRRRAARPRTPPVRGGRRRALLRCDQRLAHGLPALERRRAARPRGGRFRQRRDRARCSDAAQAVAPTLAGRRGRGGALGGVPALPDRLSAPAGGTARDPRAVGAPARLRDRVRDCRQSPPGRAHVDARGARAGLLDLLDLERRRPRQRRLVSGDR